MLISFVLGKCLSEPGQNTTTSRNPSSRISQSTWRRPKMYKLNNKMRNKTGAILQCRNHYRAVTKSLGIFLYFYRIFIYKFREQGSKLNLGRSGWPTKITKRAHCSTITKKLGEKWETSPRRPKMKNTIRPVVVMFKSELFYHFWTWLT